MGGRILIPIGLPIETLAVGGTYIDTIFSLADEYYEAAFPKRDFIPGVTQIPVSGSVFDKDELHALLEASLKMWLTAGPYARRFEKEFAQFYGLNHASLVNSGSSANLLALTSLNWNQERRLLQLRLVFLQWSTQLYRMGLCLCS